MTVHYEDPNRWAWYRQCPSTRVGMSGPALEMWKPCPQRPSTIVTRRKLRMRKSQRLTTKTPN